MNFKLCTVGVSKWPCAFSKLERSKQKCLLKKTQELNYKREVVKVNYEVCPVWQEYTERGKEDADKKQGKLF